MKKYLLILFTALCFTSVEAQDIHYSQFFTSPISLNPAKTGLFDGDYRLGANYKHQWSSIPVPFNTGSGFVEMALGQKRNAMIRRMGMGLYLAQDVAGDGNLSTTKIQFSAAYHQVLDDYYQRYYLSGGISVGYVQKHIDFTKLYWGTQWDGTQFNSNLSSKEPFRASVIRYPEINAGLEFSGIISPDKFIHAGFSMYHLNKAQETFYANDNRLGIKPIFNAGASFNFDYDYELFTELYYSYQKKASETVLSVIGGANISSSKFYRELIYFGLMYRYKDAVIPVIGYSKNNVKIYMNYDVNLSSLRAYTIARGGIEFSIQYTYDNGTHKAHRKVPCSVF